MGEKIEPTVKETDIRKVDIVTFGIEKLDKEIFISPHNDIMPLVKPIGGLWGSRYNEECWILYSNWADFAFNEMDRKYSIACKYRLKENARVYTIDTLDDLVQLLEKHGYLDPYINEKRFIDFESVGKEYDVIELTEKGQVETRMSTPNLYGWDVECVLILNFDCIDLESQSNFVPEYPPDEIDWD